MPRRVQDIVPNTHRSIRDIPLEREPEVRAPIQPPKKKAGRVSVRKIDIDTKAEPVEESVESVPESRSRTSIASKMPLTPSRAPRRPGMRKWILALMGIVIVVAIAGYLASVYFAKATFTIVPKSVPFSVNSTYISQSAPGKGVLTYELAIIKGDSTISVPATDGPKISSTAKGKITVYNGYSTQSQRLIAGTRFADDTGRIYRLSSSIVIPGYTGTAPTINPGTVSASVVADQPGDSYNISKADTISDFKIVAYKGTPKYDAIYGRVAADITGGFVGTKKTVDPTALASSTDDLKARITASLLTKLKGTIPNGYVMYPSAYVATFGTPMVGGTDAKSATVALKGTVYGILFKRDELVSKIAGDQAVATFDNFSYETPGLESLDFSIANAKDFSPEKKNTLIIKLKGEGVLVGTVPVDELKTKLMGLSLADTAGVLRTFKPVIDIEKSSGAITPPWSKVPSDTSRITVEVLTK